MGDVKDPVIVPLIAGLTPAPVLVERLKEDPLKGAGVPYVVVRVPEIVHPTPVAPYPYEMVEMPFPTTVNEKGRPCDVVPVNVPAYVPPDGAAGCDIETARPATVTDPDRGDVESFAPATYETDPLPVNDVDVPTIPTQEGPSPAVHAQPAWVVTFTPAIPPVAGKERESGETVYVQPVAAQVAKALVSWMG